MSAITPNPGLPVTYVVDPPVTLTVAAEPLTGDGSPEGAVAGGEGQQYWDKTGRTMYVKTSGSGVTGWEVFVGI